MANRYWVGGTGNWSDTAHWSTTSGGSGGASVPGISDTAIINSDSGSGGLNVDTNITVGVLKLSYISDLAIDLKNYTKNITYFFINGSTIYLGNGIINISGSFNCNADSHIYSEGSTINFTGSSTALNYGQNCYLNIVNIQSTVFYLRNVEDSEGGDIYDGNIDIGTLEISSDVIQANFQSQGIINLDNFSCNGILGNNITLQNEGHGSTFDLSITISSEVSYTNIYDCHVTGDAGPFYAYPGCNDGGGNTGWIFGETNPAPIITNISPNTSSTTGLIQVVVTGSYFIDGDTTFDWGGTTIDTGITVNEAGTQATIASIPADSAGVIEVTATTSYGTSNAVDFTYTDITSISSIIFQDSNQTEILSINSTGLYSAESKDINIIAGNDDETNGGGAVKIYAGSVVSPNTSGAGYIEITAGNAGSDGDSGTVSISGGFSNGVSRGGDLSLDSGSSSEGDGGNINISAGSGGLNGIGNGGNISLVAGVGNGGGDYGFVILQTNQSSGFALLDTNNLTSDQTFTFPDNTGTIALTSDLDSYVPYTGASTNVNLGANTLTAGQIIDSGLTAGRVTYAGTSGQLTDNANFTYNSSTGVLTNNYSTTRYTRLTASSSQAIIRWQYSAFINGNFAANASGCSANVSYGDGVSSSGGVGFTTNDTESRISTTLENTDLSRKWAVYTTVDYATVTPYIFFRDDTYLSIDMPIVTIVSDGAVEHLSFGDSSGTTTGLNINTDIYANGILGLRVKYDGDVYVSNGSFRIDSDSEKIFLGGGNDMTIWYDGTNGNIKTSDVAASDLHIQCGTDKTIVLDETVWDDLRVTPGSFDRVGVSDPTIVAYDVNGGGTNTYLWQFDKNNIASFTVQLPHSYKVGTDIYCHLHWTPGANGATESGKTVGWKVQYSWANIGSNFGTMATLDLSDTCDGTNHKHQMTDDVVIDGHTVAKGISSMLICNILRTDTGTDDTWSGTASGARPMLLEIDFHYEIDTVGSRQMSAK